MTACLCSVAKVHIGVATDELDSDSQGLYREALARRRDKLNRRMPNGMYGGVRGES